MIIDMYLCESKCSSDPINMLCLLEFCSDHSTSTALEASLDCDIRSKRIGAHINQHVFSFRGTQNYAKSFVRHTMYILKAHLLSYLKYVLDQINIDLQALLSTIAACCKFPQNQMQSIVCATFMHESSCLKEHDSKYIVSVRGTTCQNYCGGFCIQCSPARIAIYDGYSISCQVANVCIQFVFVFVLFSRIKHSTATPEIFNYKLSFETWSIVWDTVSPLIIFRSESRFGIEHLLSVHLFHWRGPQTCKEYQELKIWRFLVEGWISIHFKCCDILVLRSGSWIWSGWLMNGCPTAL